MALSLKHPELERLARRRAKRRGETLTGAVLSALKEGEKGTAKPVRKRGVAAELLRLADEMAKLPVLSTRSEDEILGYDERGIPEQ